MATRGVRGVAVDKDSILVVDGVGGSHLVGLEIVRGNIVTERFGLTADEARRLARDLMGAARWTETRAIRRMPGNG